MTPEAEGFLRRAIELAAEARKNGNPPFGSLLVGPDGSVLAEERNTTITEGNISFHPELKLAVWAAQQLSPEVAAGTTMYTSCQPCGMCSGALARSGLGKVVFALSGEQLDGLKSTGGFPAVPLEGPALYDEARVPVDGYYS
ncbi:MULTISPECIES: nucleoside deaminase [Kribbella]|uniref:tRNA(Arg) A34 adenosine deaminase TadA n=1 Tax=Kribbella pratensis TaxID=2512112 RepID=A0ABY2FKQ8_9ACTN|nr:MULTISPECIES: nucleoside deaminase [Kribbella]TDW86729.1 tRNA(Arg) A34 adenosine deaminase TadA [Kribbella sp. VKM Ac-2566]TDW93205.1 tRNA(Arg) A34 adenosine deaminase TadA [Kribbella pratensis]